MSLQQKLFPRHYGVDEVIDLVGLADKRTAWVKGLSGGQRRRLDLALGVVGAPDLLFLDEPTTGFDPGARHRAWTLIEGLRRAGTTILLTTHYIEEAERPGHYRLRAELPGIGPVHDLRVACEGSELRLDATREPPPRAARGHSEFWYGRRLRVVAFPPDVRLGTVTARYVDGVLEVSADRGVTEARRPVFPVRVNEAG